jgi:hypothetical protein
MNIKNYKLSSIALCLAAIFFCGFASSAEARHCGRGGCSNFSLNVGGFAPVVQERVVVEQYYPYYPQPVYAAPYPYYAPAPVVYVRPAPVVAARPVYRPGFSFSWNFLGR